MHFLKTEYCFVSHFQALHQAILKYYNPKFDFLRTRYKYYKEIEIGRSAH